MKFMIEFRLKPGHKQQVLETFDRVGPNRNPGVDFRGAWVGSRSDAIFVLAESDDESRIADVVRTWQAHGDATVYPVVDIEQF